MSSPVSQASSYFAHLAVGHSWLADPGAGHLQAVLVHTPAGGGSRVALRRQELSLGAALRQIHSASGDTRLPSAVLQEGALVLTGWGGWTGDIMNTSLFMCIMGFASNLVWELQL